MALHVKVVSQHEAVWSGDAYAVSVPAAAGELGILPGRQPLLASLRAGTVKIKLNEETKETVNIIVDSGFVSVDQDIVTVAAEDAKLGA